VTRSRVVVGGLLCGGAGVGAGGSRGRGARSVRLHLMHDRSAEVLNMSMSQRHPVAPLPEHCRGTPALLAGLCRRSL